MKIYRGNNVEVFDIEIDDSSSINNRMMIENTLSVSVDAPDPIDFAIGDYTVVQGERYELYDIPQVDITNDTYSYDALFLGNIHRPDNYLMEQGSAPSHNFTGTLDDHVKYIVGIINTKDSGGWSYAIGDTEEVDTSFKDINYSSMSCLAALSQVATDYGVEYDIILQHIEVAKKIQRSSSFEFAVGRGKGLYKISRGKVSNQRITTRLIALGGTTNMMYGASLALDEVFVESNVDKYGLREEKVTFEWIYPRCNSKITSDATVSETDSKVWSVSDSALDFDLNLQTIEDPKIVFTTGECAGIGFSIKSYDHLTKTVLFSEFADSEPNSGNAVPNPNRRPKAGDGYNFINIIMPDSYTVRAKAELRAAAVAELSKVSVPQSPYTIEIDPRFIKSMGRKPVCGDLVRIINSSIGLDRHIRVISCTSSVKNEDDVQIVVNDDLLSSSASSLSRSVGQIKEYISQNKVDLGGKLDSRTFYREFAPQATCLRALRSVYYDGAVMVNSVEMPGGGMLPPGVTGDILAWSAEQSLWLGRQYTEFGFLTAETLSKYVPEWAMSATKPSYVIGEIGGAEAWLTGKGFATAAQLNLKLDKAVWDDAFAIEKVGKTLHAKLPVYFDNEVVVSATNSGAVGGTSDYTQLENLPTIGGVTVIGAKTLSDYGLDLSGYALTSQIPNMSGYATQTWVTSKGYLTTSSLNGFATESWVSGKLALYLPLSGGTISGALTVNGVSTFNDAVVVSATNSGAVGGTGDYTQLENLPTIGGVTVIGAKSLKDYGLDLSGYALTSQIPNMNGYATQTWVTSKGYLTTSSLNGYIKEGDSRLTDARIPKAHDHTTANISNIETWINAKSYATITQLNNKLDKSIWAKEFDPKVDYLRVLRAAYFDGAVMVNASGSEGGGGGTTDYNDLTNKPKIGGAEVINSKTLNDYGLASYLSSYALTSQIPSLSGYATESWVTNKGYALTSQIPSLSGYATESWVTNKGYALTSQIPSLSGYATESWVTTRGYLTGITKAQVLGVMSGSGNSSQYLAGDGSFYTISYSEISGTPDLADFATQAWVMEQSYATLSDLNTVIYSHNHDTAYVKLTDSRLTDYRNALDVYAWAKAASKPSYTYSEVGAMPARIHGEIREDTYNATVLYLGWTAAQGDYTQILTPGSGSQKSLVLQSNGILSWNGSTVWHTGNFNPAAYLPLSGGTMSGNLIVPKTYCNWFYLDGISIHGFNNRVNITTADHSRPRGLNVYNLCCSHDYGDAVLAPSGGIVALGKIIGYDGITIERSTTPCTFNSDITFNGTAYFGGAVVVNA